MTQAINETTTAAGTAPSDPIEGWGIVLHVEEHLAAIDRGAHLIWAATQARELTEGAIDGIHWVADELSKAHDQLRGSFEAAMAEVRRRKTEVEAGAKATGGERVSSGALINVSNLAEKRLNGAVEILARVRDAMAHPAAEADVLSCEVVEWHDTVDLVVSALEEQRSLLADVLAEGIAS